MNREASFNRSDTLVVVDSSRRRRNLIIAVAVVVIAAVALGVMFLGNRNQASGPAAAAAAGKGKNGQIPVVTVVVPGQSQVAGIVTGSGALAARRDQPVGVAGTGGRVTAVLVDAGTWVRQGQVLASVDRSVQSQQAAQLSAQITAARANLALAQSNYERSASLVSSGFVSKADLDNKRATRDAAAAQVQVAQAQLGATRAQIGQLDVRAPTSGLVLARAIEVGQIVSPASGALFRLAKDGEMEMRATLSQQDLGSIRTGMSATVTPLGSTRSYTGRVWQVAPVIDPQSRQGEVRIAIPYDSAIKPGGFADVKIAAGSTTAPQLPQSAVLSDENGNYVFVVNGRNEVERRSIKIGSVTEGGVTIAAGLSGQESVVLSAGPFLNPGQKIQPRRQAAVR
ncbi:efflux RND transporter periplasmic adaptor subunit [Sphingomonas ginkgonis]|uniref:Efflux RND transporter periplasmic adaptor subunit n=1 Tax=Sphingomonas ginkgonis TaxID=2315330 RepID=A0A429VDE4_9SPHN|nr:efflux RND transporter periplasmic adaptor subunit [Sphingomonas ginkgonis]RST31953.1 efflux RND transporter periplasmic adaptor subunit [Sphingomonas ginkgonis]